MENQFEIALDVEMNDPSSLQMQGVTYEPQEGPLLRPIFAVALAHGFYGATPSAALECLSSGMFFQYNPYVGDSQFDAGFKMSEICALCLFPYLSRGDGADNPRWLEDTLSLGHTTGWFTAWILPIQRPGVLLLAVNSQQKGPS